MKRIITILAVAASCNAALAQYDPTTQVQYASPEASALSRIKEIPVDLYTGRVSFDIPLFQMKQGDIPLNISINYHGNGIKVDEESGLVGLGWTLNAGGCISRIVRELPDDMYDVSNHIAGYERMDSLTSPDELSGFFDYINLIKNSCQDRLPYSLEDGPDSDDDWYKTYMIYLYGDKYDEHRFESSPDNYLFHAPGLSGAFARVGERIILQSNDGCSVNYSNDAYQISDLNGQIYYFNDKEQKSYCYTAGYIWESIPNIQLPTYKVYYPSAWWLNKIVNGKGDSILFSYSDKWIAHPRKGSHGFTQFERYHDTDSNEFQHFTETCLHSSSDYLPLRDSIRHKLLSQINFATGNIVFFYAPDNGTEYLPHLDSIHIYAYPSSRLLKRIEFTYRGCRGKELLTQLIVTGTDGQHYQYSFTYKNPVAPNTNSDYCDYWGYYCPSVSGFFPSGTYFGQDVQYHGTDRLPEVEHADNNMLQTITFPTGGSVNLEWEPHDYAAYSYIGDIAIHESHSCANLTNTFVEETNRVLCGKEQDELLTTSFSIQAGRTILVDLRDYYNGATGDYASCIYDDWYHPTLVIRKNDQIWKSVNITKTNCSLITYESVPAGTYSFELQNPREGINNSCALGYIDLFNMCCPDVSLDGHIYIQSGYYPSGYSQKTYAGGVRIKKITYDAETQSGYSREYEYKQENGQSSGVLAYPPRYGSRIYYCQQVFGPDELAWINAECITLHSSPLPFVLNTDGHIGYSRVTEIMKGSSCNMNKNIYKFQAADMTHSDINDTERFYESFVPTGMMQLTSQSYLRGHLISKTEYRDDSLTTNYMYDIQELLNTDTLTGAMFTIADMRNGRISYYYNQKHINIRPYKDLGIVKYRIIPYNKRLCSVQKTGDKTNTKEWYTYANANQYTPSLNANMPTTHSFINSAGDTIKEQYAYLQNRSFVTSCITSCNGKVIDAYRYVYDSQNRIIASYKALLSQNNLPSSHTFSASNITEPVQTFTYRNNRLSEVTDCQAGQTTVYLWSYNNSYPIVEITNATYEDVTDHLSSYAIQNLRTSFTPNMDAVNALRSTLPQSLVITRTFAPLVGVTSETDAAGNTTYYDYDGLGRLHRAYIMRGNNMEILKQYEYNLSH